MDYLSKIIVTCQSELCRKINNTNNKEWNTVHKYNIC